MSSTRTLTVVAMDEEKMIAGALGDYLRRPGHDVTTVMSVSEVEDAVRKRDFDLLVLDGTVANEPTTHLCRLLRRRGFVGAIIIQSGYNELGLIQDFMDAGADDYILKPWKPDDLLARVQITLSARDHARGLDRESGSTVRDSAREITTNAARIVRDLRPSEALQSAERAIGDNNPPSDLPLTAKQAEDILAALREVRERLDGAPATAKNDTEGKLTAAVNALGNWLGKKLDVSVEEAFKTGGKLAVAAVFAHVTHLQELLVQLLAHLKVLAGH